MRSAKAVVLLAAWTCVPLFASGSTFSGGSALKYTDAAVKFGPRPSGSLANRKLQGYIKTQLTRWGVPYTTDAFVANTPAGPKPMMNIVAKIKGTSGRGVVVSGHYDTKIMPMVTFVGANDAGSSTGLLLELARTQAGKPRKDDLYIVWFDGEEAVATWTANDSLYGSRHLATKWLTDGTSKTIK
ncbi:MAG TPA: M28 family peptidase, partial [Bryobacteraceae bacterium]|nr:M28 family peptidase [Bryobacteraceae bacterium]